MTTKLQSTLAILLLAITVVITSAGFILCIATSKEGLAVSDLAVHASILATFLLNILLWVWIKKKSTIQWINHLSTVSIIYILLPMTLDLFICGTIVKNYYQSHYVAKNTKISNYEESLINWPTMSFPVGLKIKIVITNTLAHKGATLGDLAIWMGPPDVINEQRYYSYSPINIALLKPIVFNKYDHFTPQIKTDKDIILERMIYPKEIDYLESPKLFCKSEYGDTNAPIYNISNHINGILFCYFPGAGTQITQPLNYFLKNKSLFEENPALWVNMHRQFEDENLLAAGFKRCNVGPRKHCFCK